jgi:glycerate kinase
MGRSSLRVLAAVDKFRGTASAADVAAAIGRAVERAGGQCTTLPLADGGEGTLEALGGPNRSTLVMGPLGDPVRAPWRLVGRRAVIEMAQASGLALVGGPDGNDPIAATTHGTGELINAALDAGANRIVVGMGGSATTDGGLGAVRAMWAPGRLRGVRLTAACDVRTRFVDAAEVFAPQKGASSAQVALLKRRLERLAQAYIEDYGVDVRDLDGSGAAGGLAGGLAALGATLVSGFDVVADEVDLDDQIAAADLVITGEGFIDAQSFEGKVVGGVVAIAAQMERPVLAIAGEVFDGCETRVPAISLVECYGRDRAMKETTTCIEAAVASWLKSSGP